MNIEKHLAEGVRVRIQGVEGFDGEAGPIVAIHKSRGERTVYNVRTNPGKAPFSFYADELALIDRPQRRSRKAGDP